LHRFCAFVANQKRHDLVFNVIARYCITITRHAKRCISHSISVCLSSVRRWHWVKGIKLVCGCGRLKRPCAVLLAVAKFPVLHPMLWSTKSSHRQ